MSHLQPERALSVVALPAADGERVAAYEHAATCAVCAALLREHEAMLEWVDASFVPAPLSPALAARVQRAVYPRRWPRLVLGCVWLASLVLLAAAPRAGDALAAAVGAHCMLFEAAFALAPLGLGAWLSRVGRVQIQPVGFALIAGGAGLIGQWMLRTHCPVHGAVLHAFMFHFLGVLALSLLGGLVGSFVRNTSPR